MNTGDTAWVMIASALVMFMTPGLAFFYGGMVRRKNILSVLMQCFIILCLIGVQWVLYGYSLAFAPGQGFWGGFAWAGLSGVSLTPYAGYAATIPHQVFMIFQSMFAIITPALIIGAFAERMKFSAFLIIILLWATLIYDPVAHWVWGIGGWLRAIGVIDFAGGIVVHVNAGIAALVVALMIGRRKNLDKGTPAPHNVPFIALGTGMLWFGWFGFNGGSALAADGVAVNAVVVTTTSAAMAGLVWAVIEWIRGGKATLFGVCSGAVAGLAAITPASGFVNVTAALIIGAVASILCYVGVSIIKPKLGYDDSLDVFGVHGIGCIWGSLATGLFASKMINPAGADGLFFGNPSLLLTQAIGVGVVLAYSGIGTFIIVKVVDLIMKIRVKDKDESMGLDLTQHHERAYTVIE
jgi:ammonium transporter, Amt family